MAGFFTSMEKKKELSSPIKLTGCASCGLSNGPLHPKMEPTGDGEKGILFIAEAPGRDEDERNIQLIGKVGQRLRKALRVLKIDLDKDCRKTNSVRCRPPNNRTPETNEIAACKQHIFDEIKSFEPKVVIPLGGAAVKSLLMDRWVNDSDYSITRWRGLRIPDQELKCWICPTFHPSYVERTEYDIPAVTVLWERDLKRAVEISRTDFPVTPSPTITILKGKEIGDYLLDLWRRARRSDRKPYQGLTAGTHEWMECWKRNKHLQREMLKYQKGEFVGLQGNPIEIAFDYETTGLKPYAKGHRIVCCSIAESPEAACAWMWDKEHNAIFQQVMEDGTHIKKIGANNKFEENWTRAILRHKISGWLWDTVVSAHVLDNRPGSGSVAFQSYTRLGVIDFKKETNDLLWAPDCNSINQIDRIPEETLLLRNALDSAYEYGIYISQKREFDAASSHRNN